MVCRSLLSRFADIIDCIAYCFLRAFQWRTIYAKKQVCVLGSLNHPNVIKMHDFYHDDPKFYYIVLELMRGGELFGQIQTKASRE